MPGSPGIGVIQAPERVFAANHLVIWWQQAIGQSFGVNGEKGTDFNMPYRTPVGAIEGGEVVYAGLPPDSKVPGQTSLGYVVQIKNVDGSILHYQHLDSLAPGLAAGDFVAPGQVIGNSGGLPVDNFSTGPHIEVRYSPTYNAGAGIWGQNWQNPIPYFQKLGASMKPGTTGVSTIGTAYGPTGTPSSQFTSSNCAPWDIGCLLAQLEPWLRGVGVRVGLFLLGVLLLIFGFLLVAQPDTGKALRAMWEGGL